MTGLVVREPLKGAIQTKLQALFEETQDQDLLPLFDHAEEAQFAGPNDLLNTRLMENFKNFGNPTAFSLIYELNYKGFSTSIYGRIRRYYYLLDSSDILQEVFFNIYRYPYRFKSDRPESFRHWTNTIIRNTIIKHLKSQSRVNRIELAGESLQEKVDRNAATPLREAVHHESEAECSKAFLLYLHLYLSVYNRLSIKERKALFLVEVRACSYKQASEEMQIKLENLKMVIFRARKKIFRAMRKLLTVSR